MRRIFRMVMMTVVLASGVQAQQPDLALPCQDCCPDPPCYPPPPPDYPVRVAMYYPWWSGVREPGTPCWPGCRSEYCKAGPDGRCPKWKEIQNFWYHPDFDANGVFDWVPGRTRSVDLYNDWDPQVVQKQIERMAQAWVSGLVASWWNSGSTEDDKIRGVVFPTLAAQRHSLVAGTFYYESKGNNRAEKVQEAYNLLNHLWSDFRSRVLVTGDGRPVVFVYAPWYKGWSGKNQPPSPPACEVFQWWKELVLDEFQREHGVRPFLVADFHPDALTNCAAYHHKGDWGWHFYSPPAGSYYTERWAYGFRHTQTLRPGFARHCWAQPEGGRRECNYSDQEYGTPRNPQAFEAAATMAQSYWKRARYFQIITSWNEWLEFTSVEPAVEWWSSSGLGTYLDILAAHPVP